MKSGTKTSAAITKAAYILSGGVCQDRLRETAAGVLTQHRKRADTLRADPERTFARLGQIAKRVTAVAEQRGVHCVGATLAVPGLVDPGTGMLKPTGQSITVGSPVCAVFVGEQ